MRLLRRSRRPGARVVGARALCLAAVYVRGGMEYDVQTNDAVDVQDVQSAATQLGRWLMDERLYRDQSASERRLFDKPLGTWTEQEIIDANWRVESVGVLGWALSMLDSMPPYDEQFTPDDAFPSLPLVGPVGPFLDESALRPDNEVKRARDVAELWHWRSRTRHLQNDPSFEPPEGVDLSAIVEAASNISRARAATFPSRSAATFPRSESHTPIPTTTSTRSRPRSRWSATWRSTGYAATRGTGTRRRPTRSSGGRRASARAAVKPSTTPRTRPIRPSARAGRTGR